MPANVYWGIHTLRAINNFPVSGITVSDHPEIIHAYGAVKLACARANRELGGIDAYQAELVDRACSDVIAGKLDDQFPVDVLQGGAGTSTNMNVNEVIANRALELGHYPRGEYEIIHPNDTVNKSQSTNDSYPAAARLALIDASHTLIDSTRKLSASFSSLATSLIDYVGYEKAVQIAKDALAKNTTVRAAADKEGSIRPEILDSILDPRDLTRVY